MSGDQDEHGPPFFRDSQGRLIPAKELNHEKGKITKADGSEMDLVVRHVQARSLRTCEEPGCSYLTFSPRCPEHKIGSGRHKVVRRRRRFRVWDKMMRGPRDPEPKGTGEETG